MGAPAVFAAGVFEFLGAGFGLPHFYFDERKENEMDLKIYYQKIRAAEAGVPDAYPIVVSLDTPDGGKAGSFAQVSRAVAAKMMVDGTARLAKSEEADAYHAEQARAKLEADEAAAAAKMQISVVSTAELAKLKAQKDEKE